MSEIIKPPTSWSVQADLSAADLQNALGSQRLISIKSYVRGGKRLYCGIAVKDGIAGPNWTASMTPAKLRQTVKDDGGRLISLDCFWDTAAKELRCAGVWIKNSPAVNWNFGVDLTAGGVKEAYQKDSGKLTCLRVYLRPTASGPAMGEKFCAIWIADDGKPWNWDPEIGVDALSLKLEDEVGRLISIDDHAPDTWSPANEKLAAVWWRNDTGAGWFWNIGPDLTALKKEFPKFCSYGLDVVTAGPTQFASIMCQFPKKPDPDAANLVAFTGAGTAKFRPDTGEDITWQLQEQNLAPVTVSYQKAVMFAAAEGGWSWWSADFISPSGQTILGLPLSMVGGTTTASNSNWGTVTNNPKMGVFWLRAVDGGSKHQDILAQVPLTQSGKPTPAKLPANWPIFVGLQMPVESVKLTNGKNWVTVAAQICNGTGDKLTITSATVRLRDGPTILHQTAFTDNLTIDQNVQGMAVSPNVVGPVTNSNAPLPKFYDGFAVPNNFASGKLKVQGLVKFGGNLDCWGDTRDVEVKPAPVTTMTRLPYDKPVWGGSQPPGTLRWHWGSGIGGTSFNVHSYPEHRYAYDLGVWDGNNKSLSSGGDPTVNKDYYCWGQPILAMDPGVVVFVDDSNPDNVGNGGNVNKNAANAVVLYNKDKDVYYKYVHIRQNKAIDKNNKKIKVGDSILAGGQVGLIGNAGDSSEPHLHLCIGRLDAEGFFRPLPMTFLKIKNGAGNVVSGVPADNDFYGT